MKSMDQKIAEVLKNRKLNNGEITEEVIQHISIYHEELLYQNNELKQKNKQLEIMNQKLSALFTKAPVPYLITSMDGACFEWNELFENLFDTISLETNIKSFIRAEDQDDIYFLLKDLNTTDYEGITRSITVGINKDLILAEKVYVNKIKIEDDFYILWTFINITNEVEHVKKIEYLTYRDQLTNLYNRRFFREEVNRLNVSRNLPLGILMADVNGLKLINDAFGHSVGDELLVEVARTIKDLCREDEIIARVGGDEFVILVPKTSASDMKKIYERLQKGCNKIIIKGFETSVSIGYSMKEKNSDSFYKAEKEAEEMMYHQKLFMHSSQHKKVIDGIITTLHVKHPREEAHSERVSKLMVGMAKKLNFHDYKISEYRSIGLLHDIGKVAIDYTILDKSEDLTVKEFEEIQKHPEIGYRILKSAGSFQNIMDAVLHHHEKMDGSGYPKGLFGDAISIEARLLAICDMYDAITSDRPYRKARPKSYAISELNKYKGIFYDEKLVDIFLEYIDEDDMKD